MVQHATDQLDFPCLERSAKKTVFGRRANGDAMGGNACVHADQEVVFAQMNEPGDGFASPADGSWLPSASDEEVIVTQQDSMSSRFEAPVRGNSRWNDSVLGRAHP